MLRAISYEVFTESEGEKKHTQQIIFVLQNETKNAKKLIHINKCEYSSNTTTHHH